MEENFRAFLIEITLSNPRALRAASRRNIRVAVSVELVLAVEEIFDVCLQPNVFEQRRKVDWHYSSMFVGEADLKGTVKGQAIEFQVHGYRRKQGFPKSKIDTGGLGDATFTGKRKEP